MSRTNEQAALDTLKAAQGNPLELHKVMCGDRKTEPQPTASQVRKSGSARLKIDLAGNAESLEKVRQLIGILAKSEAGMTADFR